MTVKRWVFCAGTVKTDAAIHDIQKNLSLNSPAIAIRRALDFFDTLLTHFQTNSVEFSTPADSEKTGGLPPTVETLQLPFNTASLSGAGSLTNYNLDWGSEESALCASIAAKLGIGPANTCTIIGHAVNALATAARTADKDGNTDASFTQINTQKPIRTKLHIGG